MASKLHELHEEKASVWEQMKDLDKRATEGDAEASKKFDELNQKISDLNGQFPEAAFEGRAVVARNTQVIRTSTGVEFQVLMPVFNQPFRVYWAYNPTRVQDFIQPPIVADRSYFPNYPSFINSVASYGAPIPYFERRSVFRFTIGRTF